ncbi:CDP-alcohol phosphatidyltransferase family protein [Candidatus Latescibacterota bacterium]
MIIGRYNLATAVSFLGLIFSFATIILALEHYFNYAIVCLIYSGLCDLFDGVIARKLNLSKDESLFGAQIDSLIDLISFGITPILFFISIGFSNILDIILFYIYLSCAVLRLAHFNIHGLRETLKTKYYTGLPVTYAALIFPITYIFEKYIASSTFSLIVRTTFIIVAILFIVKIPIPKPSGIFYLVFPLIAFLMTFYFLAL